MYRIVWIDYNDERSSYQEAVDSVEQAYKISTRHYGACPIILHNGRITTDFDAGMTYDDMPEHIETALEERKRNWYDIGYDDPLNPSGGSGDNLNLDHFTVYSATIDDINKKFATGMRRAVIWCG
jgi:hypothetical protein